MPLVPVKRRRALLASTPIEEWPAGFIRGSHPNCSTEVDLTTPGFAPRRGERHRRTILAQSVTLWQHGDDLGPWATGVIQR
jgi:hypothetical protein